MRFAFEKRHAILASRDEKSLEAEFTKSLRSKSFELGRVSADLSVIRRFKFRFVRRGSSNGKAGIFAQAITGIEHDALCLEFFDEGRRGGAEAVVGNENSIRFSCEVGGFAFDGGLQCFGQRRGGLAIDAEDLLFGGMRPAGEKTGFCRGEPIARGD